MTTATDTTNEQTRSTTDSPIDQVREILFGHAQRENEAGVAAVQHQLVALDKSLSVQVAQLQADLSRIEKQLAQRQDVTISSIGAAIEGLGRSIKDMAKA
ncbi:MAG: hypothetical protein WA888_06035 [Burkholderiaceae bacterium]